jgi:hypothetical protein
MRRPWLIGGYRAKNKQTNKCGRMKSQYSENCLRQRFYEGMGKVTALRRNIADCGLAVIDYMV